MPRVISFGTEYFNERGDYSITGVTGAVNGFGFRQFLSDLETDRDGVDLGLPQPVNARQLYQILEQLRVPPVVDGVKVIDISGVYPTVEYISSNDGFRDAWVIGDNRGGGLRGTVKDDVILGGDGRDVILGRTGGDFVNAGPGDDRIGGGAGDDFLYGSDGNDRIRGSRGEDILQGGLGNDTLAGAQGADTFLFEDSDFGRGPSVDVIRDYRPRQGDQIVDTTGLLTVQKTGDLSPFGGGRGTLLVNELTNDRVVVYGALVSDEDIFAQYEEPGSRPDVARSMPREGIYVGGTVAEPTGAGVVNFRLQRIDGYQDGDDYIETYKVTAANTSGKTILNTAEIDIELIGGDRLDVVPGSVFGGTYRGGEFDLASGGRRALPAESEADVLQFSVANRSQVSPLGIDPSSANSFTPKFAGIEDVYYQPAFQISVEISEKSADGGVAQVFITNIGNQTLVDLDNLAFRFNDSDIDVVDEPWGAVFYSKQFAVEPWDADNDHGPLDPGARAKLFGFAFEVEDDSNASVQISDFRLTSDFDDLIT